MNQGWEGKVVKAILSKRVSFGHRVEEGKLAVCRFEFDPREVGPVLLWFRGEQDE